MPVERIMPTDLSKSDGRSTPGQKIELWLEVTTNARMPGSSSASSISAWDSRIESVDRIFARGIDK